MTDKQKLEEVLAYITSVQKQLGDLFDDADYRENTGEVFSEEDTINIQKWEGMLEITGGVLDILSK